MAASAEGIIREAQPGRVTVVFCSDVGLGRRRLRAAAEELQSIPTLVALEWQQAPSLKMELDAIRDALGDAAAALWPDWYVTAEGRFEHQQRGGHLPVELLSRIAQFPGASRSWLREAWRRCLDGKRPIVPQMVAAEQVRQLSLALDPARLLFALSVQSDAATPARLRGLAKAAEWLAHESQAKTLLLLPTSWQRRGELDHVNYGAMLLERDESAPDPPESLRPLSTEPPGATHAAPDAPQVVVGPIVGRPHPGSEVEQLLFERINADQQLAPLFEYNQRLSAHGDRHYIVDLVWRAGGLIIELDGPEHHGHMTYVRDRDRDYRLLMSGYITLRVPNDEVYVDVDPVITKIKNVVALRWQRQKGKP